MSSATAWAFEDIAWLVGHSGSNTTERVYRKQLRPVIDAGAEAMDEIFSDGDAADELTQVGVALGLAPREPNRAALTCLDLS
ncbi:hypothetical protein [Streptomyces sp. ISL-44]|uniref:hypothetical protein n=1 Tax=Streptomyces sp. ISL-44 TaxID=2819184 RepID=UPI0035AB9463